jgi:ubiquinone/menaquinone biosynthesis C-methylase UbiE
MLKKLIRNFRRVVGQKSTVRPEGEEGIRKLGHREYVGGMWEEIGKLQFNFLVHQGLKPSNCFLDIACGSLRGGVHFINYLDVGNYLGIDKESTLIQLGIEKELGKEVYDNKKPEFVVSDKFEFEKFSKKPQFSLAHSLFTHLNSKDICICLEKLSKFVEPGHIFFATFFEGDSSANPETSHSHVSFRYSREEMATFGENSGWKAIYIGNWKHPRNQMMMKYEAVW